MRLLIITYSYHPALSPRAFRWKAVAEQLQRRGHAVHVLCAAPGLEGPDGDGVTVHRVPDGLLRGHAHSAPGDAGARSSGDRSSSDRSPTDALKAGARALARALWRFFYWPDFACGWVWPASRAVRALQAAQPFDWIISSSHPFSGHLVALMARRSSSPARWLVDISDPYSLMIEPSPFNRMLYGLPSRWVEARVLKRADALSMTTASTRDLYEAAFPGAAAKTRVIGPVLSLPTFPARVRRPDGIVRLVFVGTLYRKLRSPGYLLACFAALRSALPERMLELHFYGTLNGCEEDFSDLPPQVAPFVFIHGVVSRDVVLQAMVDADVLVNIGNHSEAQLASKVIEYMAVGRPILNLSSIAQDACEAVLADYPASLTVRREPDAATPGVPQATVAALIRFVSDLRVVPEADALAVRERYAPACVARQYAEMLEGAGGPT